MAVHVFIDNSNMFGGAQRAARALEPGVPWQAIRLYYRNFFLLLENRQHVWTRVLGGSVPPGNEALWDYARYAGYDTSLLHRIAQDDGRLAEQAVDEVLHLRIANALLDYDPPQTLVIATGDGNQGEFGTSFDDQVTRALRRGWEVEVWSWQAQLSGQFQRIRLRTGETPRVMLLDPHYFSITYVRGGEYPVRGVPGTPYLTDLVAIRSIFSTCNGLCQGGLLTLLDVPPSVCYPSGRRWQRRGPKPGKQRNLDLRIGRESASRHDDCQHQGGRGPAVRDRSTQVKCW